MSINGRQQLVKMCARYSAVRPHSRGIREFIMYLLPKFKEENPDVEWEFFETRRPPEVVATYMDGTTRALPVRSLTSKGVEMRAWELRNQFRELPEFHNMPLSKVHTTIQGPWSPYLWTFEGKGDTLPEQLEYEQEQQRLKDQEILRRKEKVYFDLVIRRTVKESSARRKALQNEAAVDFRFEEPAQDKDFEHYQKVWRTRRL
eukprot:NODE_6510_length_841_cov_91.392758_g6274_i0.p1 GENE.NODE_6510_length_841_cov_91.392758_g6274_i0~~NODE_6510_length_841_cov_91.392758_g6274_i0.p1  ORF type:complete len:203 (+),score=32.83 NODE_6510_length_841_cov_91.392758_g6274_i0:103-711(+)